MTQVARGLHILLWGLWHCLGSSQAGVFGVIRVLSIRCEARTRTLALTVRGKICAVIFEAKL